MRTEQEYRNLEAENAELRKDAERYQLLKTRPIQCPTIGPDLAIWNEDSGDALRGEDADEAIDAAIKAQKEGKS